MPTLKQLKKKFDKATPVNKIISIIVVITVILIGFIILVTFAATNYASLEGESGTRTSKATVISDANASSGQALQFGSGATTAPPEPGEPLTKQQVIDTAGPRYALTQTLTSSQAKAIIIESGLLERVKVVGMLNLSDVTRPYVIRDVEVDANGGLYGIRTRIGFSGVTPPTGQQLLEYINVYGASSSGLYIQDATVRHANLWGSIDNIKSGARVEVYASWVHDQSWASGCHCDAIQIQYGVEQYYHWNVIDARYGDASIAGERAGGLSNGGLQTGSMLGDTSARFHNNWWNGGQYTVRLGNSGPPLIDYQFRNNKHGRDFSFGAIAGTTTHPSSYGGIRYDVSNIWEDTGEPVKL